MQPTNMDNELDDATVEAMLTATEESYGIGRKWFEAKARVLGLDKLELADQYAPIGEARKFSWPEAVEVVETSFGRFSPKLAEIFRGCLDAGHVDAYPRAGKGPGAYCTAVTQQILPFVLMNYTDRCATSARSRTSSATRRTTCWRSSGRTGARTVAASRWPRCRRRSRSRSPTTICSRTRTTPPHARHSQSSGSRTRSPRSTARRARALRAARVRRPRGGPRARRRAAERALGRGEHEVLRRLAPHARGIRDGVVVHPALHPRALLHLRVLVRAARRAPALPPLPRGSRGVRPEVLELLGSGGSASPADLVAPFGLDLTSTDTWREAFAELDAMRVEAETLAGA